MTRGTKLNKFKGFRNFILISSKVVDVWIGKVGGRTDDQAAQIRIPVRPTVSEWPFMGAPA
jgi:hypothetical protein